MSSRRLGQAPEQVLISRKGREEGEEGREGRGKGEMRGREGGRGGNVSRRVFLFFTDLLDYFKYVCVLMWCVEIDT